MYSRKVVYYSYISKEYFDKDNSHDLHSYIELTKEIPSCFLN